MKKFKLTLQAFAFSAAAITTAQAQLPRFVESVGMPVIACYEGFSSIRLQVTEGVLKRIFGEFMHRGGPIDAIPPRLFGKMEVTIFDPLKMASPPPPIAISNQVSITEEKQGIEHSITSVGLMPDGSFWEYRFLIPKPGDLPRQPSDPIQKRMEEFKTIGGTMIEEGRKLATRMCEETKPRPGRPARPFGLPRLKDPSHKNPGDWVVYFNFKDRSRPDLSDARLKFAVEGFEKLFNVILPADKPAP